MAGGIGLGQCLQRPVHLWMVGWANRDDEEALHRDGAAALAPSAKMQIIDDRPRASMIREVATLGEALGAMKSGLQSLERYVPPEIARRLVAGGKAAAEKETASLLPGEAAAALRADGAGQKLFKRPTAKRGRRPPGTEAAGFGVGASAPPPLPHAWP